MDRFNRRDWDGIRELITADARVNVADRFTGPLANAPYFSRYERMTVAWRMSVGQVDGEPAIIALRQTDGAWTIHSAGRIAATDRLIRLVADYTHCPWILAEASSVTVDPL